MNIKVTAENIGNIEVIPMNIVKWIVLKEALFWVKLADAMVHLQNADQIASVAQEITY